MSYNNVGVLKHGSARTSSSNNKNPIHCILYPQYWVQPALAITEDSRWAAMQYHIVSKKYKECGAKHAGAELCQAQV